MRLRSTRAIVVLSAALSLGAVLSGCTSGSADDANAPDVGSSTPSESDGTESGGADSGGADVDGADSDGADSDGADTGGADSDGADSDGADSDGADSGGVEGDSTDPAGESEPAGADAGEGDVDSIAFCSFAADASRAGSRDDFVATIDQMVNVAPTDVFADAAIAAEAFANADFEPGLDAETDEAIDRFVAYQLDECGIVASPTPPA